MKKEDYQSVELEIITFTDPEGGNTDDPVEESNSEDSAEL